MDIPVYIFTGFLESGKTTFLKRLLANPVFITGEKTLIIVCEEGIEELNKEFLDFSNAEVYVVEDEEDITPEFLEKLDEKYEPERVIIEYNCMWDIDTILNISLPKWWKKVQMGTIVDASTFKLYMNNLRSIMAEQFRKADFVLFNRCNNNTNKLALRGSVKVINQKAQVIFELENGEVDNGEDILTFDLNAEVIKVEEYDFGLWYVDIMNDIDKYLGREIILTGQSIITQKENKGFFVLQRKAMTCCAQDISSLQVICRSIKKPVPDNGQWIKVTAVVNKSYLEKFDAYLPVLIIKDYCMVDEPKDELLYFY